MFLVIHLRDCCRMVRMHIVLINPKDELVHNNIGVLRHEQGKLDQAIDAYRKAIAINPNYFEGYSNYLSKGSTCVEPICFEQP